MLINVSNHASKYWSRLQTDEALKYGEIVDYPFPNLSPNIDDNEMNAIVTTYLNNICNYENPVVMVQGEYIFTFRLVQELKKKGIVVFASRNERRVVEYVDEKGRTQRESEFQFVNFMEY